MDRRFFLRCMAGQLVLAACGQSKTSTSAPTVTTAPPQASTTSLAPPSSTAPVTTTSTLPAAEVPGGLVRRIESATSPIVIQHDASVPDYWLQMIVDTLPIGQAELGPSGPVTVHTYSSSDFFVPAYVRIRSVTESSIRDRLPSFRSEGGPGHIWQYLPNHLTPTDSSPLPAGAAGPSPPVNLLHEYFHTVQAYLSRNIFASYPTWLLEGGADYFSYRLGAEKGLLESTTPGWLNSTLSFDQKRRQAISTSKRLPSAAEAFADQAISGVRASVRTEAFNIGFLANEYLAERFGDAKTKHDFYVSITPSKEWRQALPDVFELPLDQFFSDFDAYRASL